MTIPAVTPLPTPPSRSDQPSQFAARADTFIAALPQMVSEFNTATAAITAEATATNYNATSATSVAIGTGSKSFTASTGKNFSIGQFVIVASTASPANYMQGQITAYNSSTGAMTVNVTSVGGTGTFAAWTISLGTSGGSVLTTGDQTMNGALGIGGAPVAGSNLALSKTITGAAIARSITNTGVIQSGVTSFAVIYQSNPSTVAAAFTLTNLAHFNADQGTIGAGSAVTNQFGFRASSLMTGATNNYAFYGELASGTGRWNLYMAGTADNYLNGSLGLGKAPQAGVKLDVNGIGVFVSPASGTTGGVVISDAPGNPGSAILQFTNNDRSAQYGYIVGYGNNAGIALGGGPTRPDVDNSRSCGTASFRWSVVYAVTGTINTSDERDKEWRGGLTDVELRASKRIAQELGFYQWLSSIAEKGKDKARYHFGARAQRVWSIMAEEGLIDPIVDGQPSDSAYAFLCYDEWGATEAVISPATKAVRDNGQIVRPATPASIAIPARAAGNGYGIRPDQLALFLLAGQEQRLAALEAAA